MFSKKEQVKVYRTVGRPKSIQERYVFDNAESAEQAIKLIREIREEERSYKRIEKEYEEYTAKNGIRSKIDYTTVEQIREFY